MRFLNINRRLTAITAGALDPSRGRDVLVVGSQNNILAFDVEANRDLFFREVPDGVSALTMGTIGTQPKPLVFAGGNCTVQGFDFEGNDAFWAVTGDTVSAMTVADYGDGRPQLVVGSTDFELRFFRDEEMLHESAEADKAVALAPMGGNHTGYCFFSFSRSVVSLCRVAKLRVFFAFVCGVFLSPTNPARVLSVIDDKRFALANGTVGVYRGTERLWRVRVRGQVSSVAAFGTFASLCLVLF